jgi:hypothetical protein
MNQNFIRTPVDMRLHNNKFITVWMLNTVLYPGGALGGVVVKALRYKPAGRGFDSRWYHWNFSVT